jgi:hypothetical protein
MCRIPGVWAWGLKLWFHLDLGAGIAESCFSLIFLMSTKKIERKFLFQKMMKCPRTEDLKK